MCIVASCDKLGSIQHSVNINDIMSRIVIKRFLIVEMSIIAPLMKKRESRCRNIVFN